MKTDDLKKALTQTRPRLQVADMDLLSSGSTLFDLACTGSIRGAFPKGTYTHFIGDSRSGKTLFCYNTLAEAANNPAFKDYRLIYDNPERRAFWDVEALWGNKLAARIEPPSGTANDPVYSRTVQDFYFFMYDAFAWGKDGRVDVKKSRPFVWIADSMASLDEVARWDKFETNRDLAAKGKDLEGSYGMAKAKFNSDNILWAVNAIADTGSILIVINQTRDRLPKNQFDMGPKQTVAGGHSLKFYATFEVWSSVAGEILTTVNSKKRAIGTTAEIRVKKNSVTGKSRTIEVPLYNSIGVDDLGSCVDFLVEEEHWVKEGKDIYAPMTVIKAPEFGFEGNREKLIHLIEDDEVESELRKLVGKVWNEIEAKCAVERKPRYS